MSVEVRVGTRGSALALSQTDLVIAALQARFPSIHFTRHIIQTQGDTDQTSSLRVIGGQGAFVKAIEAALRRHEIDLAVHSLKDLPAAQPADLQVWSVLPREDPRDALIARDAERLDQLPFGARVGTGSARRIVQLIALRPDLTILDIRGNVDTRLKKLEHGDYDAIVLAAAGLRRLGLHDRLTALFSPAQMLPAPGQGALAAQVRAGDTTLIELVTAIVDTPTETATRSERAFLARLGAGCRLPVAAYGQVDSQGARVTLEAMLALADGGAIERVAASAACEDAARLGGQVAEELLTRVGAANVGA